MFEPFEKSIWSLAHGKELELGPKGWLMAIINVTPDSFSDGGLYSTSDKALHYAVTCRNQGAAIVDIGGESTRPGAAPVTSGEEVARVLPVIAALSDIRNGLISIDTYRASTAQQAVSAGAHIINDVHGLQREPDIARVASDTGAGLCIMHTGRGREKLKDVIADQVAFFDVSLEIAAKAGVSHSQIVLDPGFGFNKEAAEENLELMLRFEALHQFGYPILAGTSRKRFIGHVTGKVADQRDIATAATTAILRLKGAALFRVHDVAINKDALDMADAMMAMGRSQPTGQKA